MRQEVAVGSAITSVRVVATDLAGVIDPTTLGQITGVVRLDERRRSIGRCARDRSPYSRRVDRVNHRADDVAPVIDLLWLRQSSHAGKIERLDHFNRCGRGSCSDKR